MTTNSSARDDHATTDFIDSTSELDIISEHYLFDLTSYVDLISKSLDKSYDDDFPGYTEKEKRVYHMLSAKYARSEKDDDFTAAMKEYTIDLEMDLYSRGELSSYNDDSDYDDNEYQCCHHDNAYRYESDHDDLSS